MKRIVLTMIFSFSSMVAFAAEYPISLGQQELIFTGQPEVTAESFILKDVKVVVASAPNKSFYLDVESGYGAMPLNYFCYEITQGEFPFASSYAQLGTPSWSFIFRSVQKLVIYHDGQGEAQSFLVEDYNSGTHFKNLYCSASDLEY